MNTFFINALLSNMRLVQGLDHEDYYKKKSYRTIWLGKYLRYMNPLFPVSNSSCIEKHGKIEHETQKSLSMFILGFEVEKG